jgi:hypothetical protein
MRTFADGKRRGVPVAMRDGQACRKAPCRIAVLRRVKPGSQGGSGRARSRIAATRFDRIAARSRADALRGGHETRR